MRNRTSIGEGPKRRGKARVTKAQTTDALLKAFTELQKCYDMEAVPTIGRLGHWIFRPGRHAVVVPSQDGMEGRFKKRPREKGPGAINHPTWKSDTERGRLLLALAAALRRRPPTKQAAVASQRRSRPRIEQVHALFDKYQSLGRRAARVVAAESGLSEGYVRRVRQERPKRT